MIEEELDPSSCNGMAKPANRQKPVPFNSSRGLPARLHRNSKNRILEPQPEWFTFGFSIPLCGVPDRVLLCVKAHSGPSTRERR